MDRWSLRMRARMSLAMVRRKKLAKHNVNHWQFVNDRQIIMPVVFGDSKVLKSGGRTL